MKILYFTFLSLLLASACKSDKNNSDAAQDKQAGKNADMTLIAADTLPDSTAVTTDKTAPEDKKTTIYFPKDTYDFGKITEDDVVTHIFSFTNSGDEPLEIKSARGSCGCTVPEYSKKPIAPGEKGEIKVTFNSKGKVGPNTKGVFIEANTEPELTILKITVEVLPKGKIQPTKEEKEKLQEQKKQQM